MGRGRIRKLAATAPRAARAYAGDPKAIARLVRDAVHNTPRALRVGVAAGIATAAVMAMTAAAESDREVDIPIGVLAGSGEAFNAAPQVWTSYQIAGSVLCLPGGGSALWTDSTFTPPVGDRLDWRLVAAIGQVESGHAFDTPVNAFGDLLAPMVGPLLGVADTDRGRFDFSASRDARVGPLALLPSEVVSDGLDGNGDQIVDPHNVWDSAATAASLLCSLGVVDDPAKALLRWRGDPDWADRVLDVWVDMERTVPSAPGAVPWGAPLAYTPTSAAAGPVLAALMASWGAPPTMWTVSPGRASGGSLRHPGGTAGQAYGKRASRRRWLWEASVWPPPGIPPATTASRLGTLTGWPGRWRPLPLRSPPATRLRSGGRSLCPRPTPPGRPPPPATRWNSR